MNRRLIFVLLSFFPFCLAGQVRPLSNLYNLDKLVFNPAFAGSQGALSATALYRNQWVGFNDAPKNYSFSAHAPLHNDQMSLGFWLKKTAWEYSG